MKHRGRWNAGQWTTQSDKIFRKDLMDSIKKLQRKKRRAKKKDQDER